MKRAPLISQEISLIHELGHRNYFKFLPKSKVNESDTRYSQERLSPKSNKNIVPGNILVYKDTGDIFRVQDIKYEKKLKYSVILVQLGENSLYTEKDIRKPYSILSETIGIDVLIMDIKGNLKDENSFVPRTYALKNKFEFYAVLWETWFNNKLKEPAKSWFEDLHK
jgi:hypothetical protein